MVKNKEIRMVSPVANALICWLSTLALSLYACVFLEGCCSRPKVISEVNEFRDKNPTEYREFLYLNPINLDTYRCMLGLRLTVASDITREIKVKFGAIPGVVEYAENKLSQEAEECQTTLRQYSELEALCLPGGIICQFARTNGMTKEIGLLVLKEGRIVKRDVWVVDYPKEKK